MLLGEQLSRNCKFFGDESQAQVQASRVIVVGLGGVGSHAAHMLARSGVGYIRLIDFDVVTLSSLNRHACAVRRDVSLPKVKVLEQHILAFSPSTVVDARVALFEASKADSLLEGSPDFVLDCIDDVKTKTELLMYCRERGIRVVTAMGAGGKVDPTRVHLGDISDAIKDPLASKVRYLLRKAGQEESGIPTVYSSELSARVLCPLEGEALEAPQEFGALENFRVRVLPVLGTMPATFGMAMAAFVLCQLALQPFVPAAVPRTWQHKTIHTLTQRLGNREAKVFGNKEDLDMHIEDVEFVIREIWRYRSVVDGNRNHLILSRWDVTKPASLFNLVLLTEPQANALVTAGGNAVFGERVQQFVKERLLTYTNLYRSVY